MKQWVHLQLHEDPNRSNDGEMQSLSVVMAAIPHIFTCAAGTARETPIPHRTQ